MCQAHMTASTAHTLQCKAVPLREEERKPRRGKRGCNNVKTQPQRLLYTHIDNARRFVIIT